MRYKNDNDFDILYNFLTMVLISASPFFIAQSHVDRAVLIFILEKDLNIVSQSVMTNAIIRQLISTSNIYSTKDIGYTIKYAQVIK